MQDAFYPALYNTVTAGLRWDRQTLARLQNPVFLESYGYKVYSQNDEDGILEEIFDRIGVVHKTFVEFGAEQGLENNTHYLLHKGWSGLWMEGNQLSFQSLCNRFRPAIGSGQLKVHNAYVDRDNIDRILASHQMQGEIDLLSIDIDGNDFHVFKAISVVSPRVVVIEYNGKFPPGCEWVMAHHPSYQWNGSDRQGASLKSLEKLGTQKGYQLVGTNINGTNAFFVRQDLAKDRFALPATAENLYNPCRFSLVHGNGHHPRVYLKNETEGPRGDFLYCLPDQDFVVCSGFYDAQYNDAGGFSVQWMSAKTGVLYVMAKQDGARQLQLQLGSKKDIMLRLTTDTGVFVEREISSGGRADYTIDLVKPCDKDTIVQVTLQIDTLWYPEAPEGYVKNTRPPGCGLGLHDAKLQ